MTRRILIADATVLHRISLKASLASARYEVVTVDDADAAFDVVRRGGADVVLACQSLPPTGGVALCQKIARLPSAPPVLLMGGEDDSEVRTEAMAAGATALLRRPLDRDWLLTMLRSLTRAAETWAELSRRAASAERMGFAEPASAFLPAARVACVGRSLNTATAMAHSLRHLKGVQITPMTPAAALNETSPAATPDAYVLCHELEADGLWVLSELRATSNARRSAIIVEYDGGDRTKAARALDQGANDVMPSDASSDERALRLSRALARKREIDRLRRSLDAGLHLAARDPLTGLYNRRYAFGHLAELAAKPRAVGRGYGVMVIDVDHFKRINDSFGHNVGDDVLVEISRRLQNNVRDGDFVARLGGEEFLVALADTTYEEAEAAAERLRREIAREPISVDPETEHPCTVSIGVICVSDPDAPQRAVIADADAALYAAKAGGRNTVRSARPRLPSSMQWPRPANSLQKPVRSAT